jgi:hypothetical protein
MESILEMIQGLISKIFGSSAMSIQSLIDKNIEFVGSVFGSLKPATRNLLEPGSAQIG